MNTKQQQAALAKLNTKPAKGTKQATHEADATPVLITVASVVGSVPSHVIGATKSVREGARDFFGAMKTSYQYHEAKRKGLL